MSYGNPIPQGIKKPTEVSGRCYLCMLPLLLSKGQVAFWHGECRKKGRALMTF